jgi:Ca2+-binding RTX toxin-like protein
MVGTSAPDVIRGTGRRDVVWAGAGDDLVFAGGRNDVVCGEAGADVVLGGDGSDRISGGPGDDLLGGGRGNDWLRGAGGTDIARGELGDDRVEGGPGRGDEVGGDLGIDHLDGGAGNRDLVHGDYGDDRMFGGPGAHDIASFALDVSGDKGRGVNASLADQAARGDGVDVLAQIEDIEGSPFDDVLIGLGARTRIDGGGGTDVCRGFGAASSCGREPPPSADALVQLDRSPVGGDRLMLTSRAGDAELSVTYDQGSHSFNVTSGAGLALGPGCDRPGSDPRTASCVAEAPLRGVLVDLGHGDDRLTLGAGLELAGPVRVNGGLGDDHIRGGEASDLIEAGLGADRLAGGGGSDGLIGGFGGPDLLFGQRGSDVLAAGGGCIGGRLVGGPGHDNASFAETPAHPGVLVASLARGLALVTTVRECKGVRIAGSAEDLEGSFDWDILIGDGGRNTLYGQPGLDYFYGRRGADVIYARDGERDAAIDCGPGRDAVFRDRRDPAPRGC